MAIRNNYDIEWIDEDGQSGCGIFNGDIGIITEINREDQSFTLWFDDGRRAVLDYACFDDIEHAYAITVHKSQGSEYPIVILPLGSAPGMLHSRNLLYTAVTRAQSMVILVGRSDIIERMVDNDRQSMRYTGLAERLTSE